MHCFDHTNQTAYSSRNCGEKVDEIYAFISLDQRCQFNSEFVSSSETALYVAGWVIEQSKQHAK